MTLTGVSGIPTSVLRFSKKKRKGSQQISDVRNCNRITYLLHASSLVKILEMNLPLRKGGLISLLYRLSFYGQYIAKYIMPSGRKFNFWSLLRNLSIMSNWVFIPGCYNSVHVHTALIFRSFFFLIPFFYGVCFPDFLTPFRSTVRLVPVIAHVLQIAIQFV